MKWLECPEQDYFASLGKLGLPSWRQGFLRCSQFCGVFSLNRMLELLSSVSFLPTFGIGFFSLLCGYLDSWFEGCLMDLQRDWKAVLCFLFLWGSCPPFFFVPLYPFVLFFSKWIISFSKKEKFWLHLELKWICNFQW